MFAILTCSSQACLSEDSMEAFLTPSSCAFSFSAQSVDLHFFPPGCERLLPAHPWSEQEWAYCGRQVRRKAPLTHRASHDNDASEELCWSSFYWSSELAPHTHHSVGMRVCASMSVCVCPGLTLLQAHGHTNIHKNKALRLRDTHSVASNPLCCKLTAAKMACHPPPRSPRPHLIFMSCQTHTRTHALTFFFFFFLLSFSSWMQEFPLPTEPQQHVARSGRETFIFPLLMSLLFALKFPGCLCGSSKQKISV